MLGRLRMRVEDCVTEYERLGKEVFGKPRPLKYYKYSHTNLERVIKDVVQRHCRDGHSAGNGRDLLEQPESHINRCRTAVVTVRRNKPGNDKVHLFRSYIHTRTVFERNPAARARERNPDDPDSVYIWEAGRATSAAPHYFHEITIHGNDYMDGGVEENNPSAEAWYEASQMHSQRSGPRDLHGPGIGVFVSVGTGLSAPVSFFSKGNSIRKVAAIFKKARKSLTDPERTEKQVRVMASNTDVPYYRLNVTTGLENMKMDQWQTLKSRGEEHNITLASIQKETKKYLELDGTKREIFRCATKLVDYRRKRCPNDEARRFSGLTTPGPGQRSLQHQAPTHHSLGVPHATMTPEADSGQQSQHLSPQQQRSHTTNSHQSRQWQRSYIQEQQEAAQEMPSRDGHPPHGFPYFEYQRGPPQHTSDEYNSSSTYYPASSPVEMPQPLTIHEV
ncbi:MAG: hypothetical protein M1812_000280 [Candelaria pacifica]|nr:MAG: hypothetical protein M1812_000280 [Candelaria pacifica]